MTKIDPSRLTAIFRALSTTETYKNQSLESSQEQKKTTNSKSISIESKPKRDKTVLKRAILARLKKLKKEDPEFTQNATLVTVKEILLWEFGEELINHPDFNYISHIVTDQVNINQSLNNYMNKLLNNLEN